MSITIRPITPKDAEGYNSALDQVARERRFLRLTEAPPLESSRSFVASNIAQGNPHFVAMDGEGLVGWCDICRSSDFGTLHSGWLGMGLIASYRGRGIGLRLLAAALEAARPGFHRVELEVYESNKAAIALYEKVGFAHEGRRQDAVQLGGDYQDIVMMGFIMPASWRAGA